MGREGALGEFWKEGWGRTGGAVRPASGRRAVEARNICKAAAGEALAGGCCGDLALRLTQ